jgi:ELWxxDGT repeat protein
VLVKEIRPGNGGPLPQQFSAVAGQTLFTAGDDVNGTELWKTDGTEAGTVLVKDIRPGSTGSGPGSLVVVGGTLFFTADDGVHGRELWKSDGTSEGTQLVLDLTPGSAQTALLGSLVGAGASLYFVANDGVHGNELWKSDGTAGGTVLVKDVYPGVANGALTAPVVSGSLVVFSGHDGVSGEEPWASDGTAANTHRVAEIAPGSGGSSPADFVASGSRVFFRASALETGRELYAVPTNRLLDSDGDGLDYAAETAHGSDPFDTDSDDDGLSDAVEVNVHGTSPILADTDGDGYTDPIEIQNHTDPLDPNDPGGAPEVPLAGPLALGALAALLLLAARRHLRASALCVALLAAGVARADIAPAFLVKDIETEPSGTANGFYVGWSEGIADLGGVAYFFASTPETGYELWRSDGTEAGTARVKDARVGAQPFQLPSANGGAALSPTNLNGTLFFRVDDGLSGVELWKSDGTSAGTVRVKDIRRGRASSDPKTLRGVGGTLFFTADEGVSGRELWKSDGTEAGTVRVKDIRPGAEGITAYYSANQLVNVNGTVFFNACDLSACFGLWKSDGTEAGTVLVKAFESDDPQLYEMTAVGDRLYFWMLTSPYYPARVELWTSDGTSAGTVSLGFLTGEFEPKGFYDNFSLTSAGGTLFFTSEDAVTGRELWRSDGTAASTVRVKDIVPGTGGSFPGSLFEENGTLFFSAQDADHGRELWKSDGTEAGTVLVADVVAGSSGSDPSLLTNVNGTLFFSALDGSTRELWKSDGTEAGTVHVSDVGPTYGPVVRVGGALFYVSYETGDLWTSDGTPSGTHSVAQTEHPEGSFPQDFASLNGAVYFSARTLANGWELWKTDGTAAGTALLKDIVAGPNSSYANSSLNANGTLFFIATGGLWKSNGTAAGTVNVKSMGTSVPSSQRPRFTNVNGTVFFNADDHGNVAFRLYKSNGTGAGTVPVNAGTAAVSDPKWITNVNGTLFLSAANFPGSGVDGLHKSDGTNAGTVRLKDVVGSELTAANGTLFFYVSSGSGRGLWKSDGTTDGTIRVKDIRPGASGWNPRSIASIGGMVFFAGDDGTSGSELWKSVGTDAGTVRVKDIQPGSGGSNPSALTNLNGTLLFAADDGVHGRELWRSDGTEAGTVLVEERRPGIAGTSLDQMAIVGSRVVFYDNDGVTGEELWTSDGTAAGTHLVADIAPTGGSQVVYPPAFNVHLAEDLATLGPLLFFAAETDALGRELYAVPIAALDDGDQDGLQDQAEVILGTNPDVADSDGDGLTDGAEFTTHGTDPLVADSDGDGFGDGVEVTAGTDPLDPASHPPSVPLAGPLALGALVASLLVSSWRSASGRR